jgi:hypothetical protein
MIGYLLEQGSEQATAPRIRLLEDCAEISQTAANFMIRGSPMHGLVCFVCAEVCEASADECQRYADDPTEAECLDACRRCAESCRQMAMESGVSVEYMNRDENGLHYGDAFEQVADAAEEEARTSGGRTRRRPETGV